MEQHFRFSSFREKLIEHLFVAEMLKASWQRSECSLEIAKPEVDNRGYDLIAERAGVVRHIQLKASHRDARASAQKIHRGLAEKPSGCVVWVVFDEITLKLGPFLFFGGSAGEALPCIAELKVAKHAKANMQGIKSERPDLRVVPKVRFQVVPSVEDLFDRLFHPEQSRNSTLREIERHFHALMRERIADFPEIEELPLPELTSPLPYEVRAWFPVPGMYGGFSYWLEGKDEEAKLITESWCRVVGGSGQRHEVTANGSRLTAEGFV